MELVALQVCFVFTKLSILKHRPNTGNIAQFTTSAMRTTKNFHVQRSNAVGIGPQLTFAAVIFAGLAVWTGLSITLPADVVVPIVATLSFGFAAALAVVASVRGFENPACVTYADVAGAVTLIGVCIAATIEPEQMVRIIGGDSARP